MSLIELVRPDEAEGEIKQTYDRFIQGAGQIPKPVEMFSVSPGLFKIKAETVGYYGRTNLSFPLRTLIRYLTAEDCNHGACIRFNSDLLKRQGMTDEELELVKSRPDQAPLEENENQLLAFVIRAVKNPESVTEDDLENLRESGWNDRDIFEAVNHGADMISSSILMKVFQIECP